MTFPVSYRLSYLMAHPLSLLCMVRILNLTVSDWVVGKLFCS